VGLPEEFDYTAYMALKEQEQVRNTDISRDYIDNIKDIVYYRYDPHRYYMFWIKTRWRFRFFIIIVFTLIIYILDVIFYQQGEYIHNMLILWTPFVSLPLLLLMEKYLKPYREWLRGKELYLYKYQAFLIKPPLKRGKGSFFWTDDLKYKLAVEQNNIFSERWWRTNKAVYKKDKTIALTQSRDLAMYLVMIWLLFIYINYRFIYRQIPYLWDYYDEDVLYPYLIGHTEPSYAQRSWFFDSWFRLEFGGNPYTVWYINKYRQYTGKKFMELDYGTVPKKSEAIKMAFEWVNYGPSGVDHPYYSVQMEASWGDVEWMNMTLRLENFIQNSRVLEVVSYDLKLQKSPWALSDHEIDIVFSKKVRLKADFLINLKADLLHEKIAEYKEAILQAVSYTHLRAHETM
jgi:hypothetical protein